MYCIRDGNRVKIMQLSSIFRTLILGHTFLLLRVCEECNKLDFNQQNHPHRHSLPRLGQSFLVPLAPSFPNTEWHYQSTA